MHRLFVPPEALRQDEVLFPSDAAHQLSRVLRFDVGDDLWVLVGDGLEHRVQLIELSRGTARGRVMATQPNEAEPATQLTLFPALLKGKNLEWVLQKGTELGVAHFVPIVTTRSVADDAPKRRDNKLARWARIVQEAAEQSGRGRIPTIAGPVPFREALRLADPTGVLLPWEQGGQPLRSALRDAPDSISVFIGPEGGFTTGEVDQARTAGATIMTMGPRILRAETASVAVVAAIMAERGEWRMG